MISCTKARKAERRRCAVTMDKGRMEEKKETKREKGNTPCPTQGRRARKGWAGEWWPCHKTRDPLSRHLPAPILSAQPLGCIVLQGWGEKNCGTGSSAPIPLRWNAPAYARSTTLCSSHVHAHACCCGVTTYLEWQWSCILALSAYGVRRRGDRQSSLKYATSN